ncbi:hypothetical protein SSPNP10_34360 [Streptomyces sp. NP10]|nr:hypothetical protein SSPNP10_34360 [Streptomyces sp. NP10]SNB90961.1 hypothetical protein SAMN02745831_07278 [Streptomyces sp. PgraA7]
MEEFGFASSSGLPAVQIRILDVLRWLYSGESGLVSSAHCGRWRPGRRA